MTIIVDVNKYKKQRKLDELKKLWLVSSGCLRRLR